MVQKVNFNNLTGDTLTVGNTVIDGTGVSVNGSRLGGSVEIYSNNASLPTSGLTKGSFLFSQSNASLYYSDGNGFYRLTLINETPSITFDVNSVTLGDSGNTAFINYTVVDPEGAPTTLTVSNSGISNTNIVTITNYTGNNTLQIQNVGMSVSNTYTLSLSAEDDVGNIGIASANIIIDIATPVSFTYLNTPDGILGGSVSRTVSSISTSTSGIASQTVAGESFEVDGNSDYLRYITSGVTTSFTSSSSYKFVWAINIPFQNDIGIGMSFKDGSGDSISLHTYSNKVVAFQGTGTTSRVLSPTMATNQWYIMTVNSNFTLSQLFRAKTPGGTPYDINCVTSGGGYAPAYATNNNELIFFGPGSGVISGYTSRALMEQRIAGVALYPTTMTDDEMLNAFDAEVFGN